MADGSSTRKISLVIEGIFNAGGPTSSPKNWLTDIQKQTDKASKESLEYAVRNTKAKTKAEEDEAKKRAKIADEEQKHQAKVDKESLEYAVRNVKAKTKAKTDENKKLENQLATDLKKTQRLHEQTDQVIENSAKKLADVRIREAKRAAKEFANSLNQPPGGGGPGGGGSSGGGDFGSVMGSVFGGTFLGVLAGGGALGAISATIGLVTSLANEVKDLGIESVKLAGDFEVTVNSMRVFTGSTSAAKAELADMDKLARNTPGLRMADAEAGALRLRALGFEAKVAQDFVVGLAKHKLLSGSDEMAMQRVLVNLTQLSTGSPRMSQDIKEMILSMPTLRNAMIDTFGTIEKFKAELQQDPDAALKKFAAGLKNTETASAGLNDGVGKLLDSLIDAGRQFGEPLLDPLTSDVKDLTQFVYDNRDAWKNWGQGVADAVQGASDVVRGAKALSHFLGLDIPDEDAGILRRGLREGGRMGVRTAVGIGTSGLSEAYFGLQNLGETERKKQEEKKLAESFSKESEIRRQLGLSDSFVGPVSEDMIKERAAAELTRTRTEAADAELKRLREVEFSPSYRDKNLQFLNDAFALEQAQRDSHLRFTLQQELDFQSQSSNARRNNIQQQILLQKSYFDRQLQLADDDKDKIEAIEIDKAKVLSGLNRELYENEFKAHKQRLELEKQIADQKRKALIDLKALQITGLSSGRESQLFDINRQLGKEVGGAESQFQKLIDVTNSSYQKIAQLTRDSYAEQLKDQSLTAEQRTNLEFKLQLDLQQLAEQNRRALIEIDDRKTQRILENLRRQREEASANYKYLSERASSFSTQFFNPETFSSQSLSGYKTNVLKNQDHEFWSVDTELRDQSIKSSAAADLYAQQLKSPDISQAALNALSDAYFNAANRVATLKERFNELVEDTPKGYYEFARLADTISTKNVGAFDELSTAILKHRQNLNSADVDSEIDYWETQIKLAQVATNGQKDAEKEREAIFQRNQARRKKEKLDLDQLAESTDQYANSLKGLAEKLRNLHTDDKTQAGTLYGVRQQILKEQIALAEENISLEERIGRVGEDSADRYRNAWLKATLEVRDARIQANEDIIKSNVRLDDATKVHGVQVKASFLRHLEDQKTATQATSDLLTGLYDKAAEGLDKLFDKGKVGKIPVIGDYLKAMARTQLTQTARRFADFLPDDLKAVITDPKTGNPLLDENIKQSTYLKEINDKLGGAAIPGVSDGAKGGSIVTTVLNKVFDIGPGGTAPWNPNADRSVVPPTGTIDADGNFVVNGNEDVVDDVDPFDTGSGGKVSNVLGNIFGDLFTNVVNREGPASTSQNPVIAEAKAHTALLKLIAKNTSALPKGYKPNGGTLPGVWDKFFGGGGAVPLGGDDEDSASGGRGNLLSDLIGGGDMDSAEPDERSGAATGSGGGGFGGLKGLKSMFGPRKNILTGKDSKAAGIMGGVGGLMGMAGGLIGGRAGGVLSMAGTGMQIGSMFGPWGAAIGAGVGAIVGWFTGKDDAIKKLKEAAISDFGITVKDKKVLESLKNLGEGMFGKGQVGPNAHAVVKSEDGMNILRAYAEQSGQSGLKIDRLNYGDPNWQGNNFRSGFGGFREKGGPVEAGKAYVVGEKKAELFIPDVPGRILPEVPADFGKPRTRRSSVIAGYADLIDDSRYEVATAARRSEPVSTEMLKTAAAAGSSTRSTTEMDPRIIEMVAGFMRSMDDVAAAVSNLRGIPKGQLVQQGLEENPSVALDAVEHTLDNDGTRATKLFKLTGL